MTKFSERHGFSEPDREIVIRNDAPEEMRSVILDIGYELGLTPKPMRSLLCRVLRKKPNENNWSEWPNIESECQRLIFDCKWYDVYDVIEEIYKSLSKPDFHDHANGPGYAASGFEREINRYFRREGIGWQLLNGAIEMRGAEAFETAIHEAQEALTTLGKHTASSELHEAIQDLSRRPEPDVTGAVQHAMSALECVMREISGDGKSTLGELLKRHPTIFPKPLDQAVEKLWGYSSESGRHLREGNAPSFEEAELIVGLCGTLCRYLARKLAG